MPGPSPDEVPLARWHLVVSMAFLVLATLDLLRAPAVTFGTLRNPTLLVGLGAFPVLVLGTSRMLLPGLARRPVAGPQALGWVALVLATVGAVGAVLAPGLPTPLAWLAVLPWSLALVLAAGVVGASLRQRPREGSPPVEGTVRQVAVGTMAVAALAYGAAAAVLLPLHVLGHVPFPALVHVLLPGLVVCTLGAVAVPLLERFTGVAAATPLVAVAGPGLAAGPALVAAGLAGHDAAFQVGAVVETLGLVAFAAAVLGSLARAPARRRRPSHAGYGAAAFFALVGVGLGAAFAADPAWRRLVPVHALANALGFVGLTVLAASVDLYAPALQLHRDGMTRQARWVLSSGILGVALAVAGTWAGRPLMARVGLVGFGLAAALQLAGALVLARSSRS